MLVDMVENAKKEREKLVENTKIETAQNLLEMGDSVEKVSKAVDLPIEKIKELKDNLKAE
jgi:predicted transposase YdaD